MTNSQPASDTLLMSYAAGHLSPAPALIVASHIAMSDDSAARLTRFEQLGGVLLDEQPLADVGADLFQRTLERLTDNSESSLTSRKPTVARDDKKLDLGVVLPAPLVERSIGNWRWVAPGIRFAKVEVPEDPDHKVLLLRVAAGKSLPQHGHAGSELTLVLKGSFSDDGGTFGPGDIEEEDSDVNHQPRVGPEGECICVTVIEGSLRPSNWIARIMMPVLGF